MSYPLSGLLSVYRQRPDIERGWLRLSSPYYSLFQELGTETFIGNFAKGFLRLAYTFRNKLLHKEW